MARVAAVAGQKQTWSNMDPLWFVQFPHDYSISMAERLKKKMKTRKTETRQRQAGHYSAPDTASTSSTAPYSVLLFAPLFCLALLY
jgi:hypothetical protein